MNKKHADFIRKELIPFILRERGRGFAMDVWRGRVSGRPTFDGVRRSAPSCGTIACIGGSVEILKPFHPPRESLGLDGRHSWGLFHEEQSMRERFGWPPSFARRYKRARTARGKAQVAAELLELVAQSRGRVLDGNAATRA